MLKVTNMATERHFEAIFDNFHASVLMIIMHRIIPLNFIIIDL
jgi:hypothetical protein